MSEGRGARRSRGVRAPLGQGLRGLGVGPASPQGRRRPCGPRRRRGARGPLAVTLDDVAAEIARRGRALAVPTNIADPAACAAIVAAATEEFGGVDVLVNNAFRFDAFQSFEEVDLDRWRKIMETNLFGSLQ